MKSRKVFWVSILLLAILGLEGCPQPPSQQKAGAPSSQEQEKKEKPEQEKD